MGALKFGGVEVWGRRSLGASKFGSVDVPVCKSLRASKFGGVKVLGASSFGVVAACSCSIFDPINVPILKTRISQISVFFEVRVLFKGRRNQDLASGIGNRN